MGDLAAAIRTAEFNRQTHVEWRDYWLATGCRGECDECQPTVKAAGGLAHQERCIVEYDNILACLRAALANPSAAQGEGEVPR